VYIMSFFIKGFKRLNPLRTTSTQTSHNGHNPSATKGKDEKGREYCNLFTWFPDEIVEHIFTFLPARSLLDVSCVNRSFNFIAGGDNLWIPFIEKKGFGPNLDPNTTCKAFYKTCLLQESRQIVDIAIAIQTKSRSLNKDTPFAKSIERKLAETEKKLNKLNKKLAEYEEKSSEFESIWKKELVEILSNSRNKEEIDKKLSEFNVKHLPNFDSSDPKQEYYDLKDLETFNHSYAPVKTRKLIPKPINPYIKNIEKTKKEIKRTGLKHDMFEKEALKFINRREELYNKIKKSSKNISLLSKKKDEKLIKIISNAIKFGIEEKNAYLTKYRVHILNIVVVFHQIHYVSSDASDLNKQLRFLLLVEADAPSFLTELYQRGEIMVKTKNVSHTCNLKDSMLSDRPILIALSQKNHKMLEKLLHEFGISPNQKDLEEAIERRDSISVGLLLNYYTKKFPATLIVLAIQKCSASGKKKEKSAAIIELICQYVKKEEVQEWEEHRDKIKDLCNEFLKNDSPLRQKLVDAGLLEPEEQQQTEQAHQTNP
jgi:hypothetical protein